MYHLSSQCSIYGMRVFIIHGWEGFPEEGWFPWLKNELQKKGIEVQVPHMPDADVPTIEKWVAHLSSIVGTPDEQTYFVGHSIGCQTILRYVETIPSQVKIGGVVLVAGFFTLTNLEDEKAQEIARPWLTRPIDCKKVLSHTERITAIFSDNDLYVPLENVKLFEERLHPKIIIQKQQGHFSGSNGITELPAVLQELIG
jgi:uncharacterized protein